MADGGLIHVVADDAVGAETLREMLERDRYEVDVRGSDLAATDEAPAPTPNLVLIDADISAADPFELVTGMRRRRPFHDVPVIFMVARDDAEGWAKGLESGDDLIVKPFDAREVLARVERQVTVSKVRTALRESEAKLRSVTESAIDAIISADHTGRIISWNRAATRILGFMEAEVVGRRLEMIIPERFREAHRAGLARFTATGEPHIIGTTVELSARRNDGEEVPIELSLSTWTVRDDRYYTGIIRDIGERKRAEEALRASEQTLRERTDELKRKNDALQETLDRLNQMQNQLIMQEKLASLGRLSAGMAHELNNPASSAQRGAAQLQAMFARWPSVQARIGRLELDDAKAARLVELDESARGRAAKPAELTALVRSDREAALEAWFADRGVDVDGDVPPALVNLGWDESDLEALGNAFDRDGLAVVVNWLAFKYDAYALVNEITLGTGRIVELVGALKTYTYMDQAPVQEVDLRKGLDNTLIILHSKLKRGVTVVREYDDDLPAVEAYAGELNQVWTNIIDNAIDAMGGIGTLTVRAWREDPWAVVQIEDDGPGIPPDVQSKLFDPFFTTKPLGKGTGLGLNISRNIVVQRHHGDLAVASRPGRTCFTVRLPVDFHPTD